MKTILGMTAALAFTGCALAPGMYAGGIDTGTEIVAKDPNTGEGIPVAIMRLSAATLDTSPSMSGIAQERPRPYRLGPGDVVNIVVWEHPELTIPQGEFRSAEASGSMIDQDGQLFYPYCGLIPASGLTRLELRAEIARCLSRVIRDPQVDVRISLFRSQRVAVAGAVLEPGFVPITDVPVYAMDAVQASGGLTPEASLRFVRLSRGGEVYDIDLQRYTRDGDARHNPLLRAGDTLYISRAEENRVNILGEVVLPQTLALDETTETLADVLARARGLNNATAEPARILVLRQLQSGNAVLWMKGDDPIEMAAAQRFTLKHGDVVYVDQTGLTRWNRVISSLIPGNVTGLGSAAIITSGR